MKLFLTLNTFLIILIFVNILFYTDVITASVELAILCMAVYLTMIFTVFLKEPFFFFMILIFAVFQATSIISNVYLESGAYLTQTQIYTYATGATLRLVTINSFFIYFSYLFYIFYKNNFTKFRKLRIFPIHSFVKVTHIEKLFFLSMASVLSLMIVNGLLYPFPLLSLSQRFEYWNMHPLGGLFSKILYFLSYLSIILAFYIEKYKNNKKIKRKLYFLAFSSIIIAILYSNKFSWLSNFLVMWMIGFISAKYIYNEYIPLNKIVKSLLIIIPSLLVVISLSYMFIHGYVGSDLTDMIMNRIFSMQGEMFWAIDEFVLKHNISPNIYDLILKYDNGPSGIFLLMELVAPPSTFKHFYDNQIPFTMAYPAITMYAVGYINAIAIQIFFAFYWVSIVVSLLISLQNNIIIRFYISLFLFAAMLWAMLLGSTYVLFSKLNLIFLVLLLIDLLLYKFYPKNTRYTVIKQ